MKSKYKLSDGVKRTRWRYSAKERYYQKSTAELLVSYDRDFEEVLSNPADTIECLLDKKCEIAALEKALSNLSDGERQMIRECYFFAGKKRPTYTQLARSCGISRQAYCKRLNKLLMKLKSLVEFYLEDF